MQAGLTPLTMAWQPAPDGQSFQLLLAVPLPGAPTQGIPFLVLALDKAEAESLETALRQFRGGLIVATGIPEPVGLAGLTDRQRTPRWNEHKTRGS